MDKYLTFANHLRVAMDMGESVGASHNNSGACNFDSVSVRLPRWRKEGVEEAARIAGVTCYKEGNRWMFIPKGNGYGWSRTVNAQTAAKILKMNGYDASVWYMMD